VTEKQISVKLSDDTIQALDTFAVIIGKSRHDLIRNILEITVDDIKDLKQVGIFQLGMMIRDLQHGIEDKLGLKQKTKNDGEGKPIPVKLTEEFIEQLDQLAGRADISRHKLMQNFIKVGLEEMVFLEKTGALKVATILRDLVKGFKKIYDLGKKAYTATGKKEGR